MMSPEVRRRAVRERTRESLTQPAAEIRRARMRRP
jgi:hypothetical protein